MVMSNRATMGGKVFKSDGEPFSWADWLQFMQTYSLTYESFMNGASRLSKRVRNIATSTYYIGLDVPEGRELIIFDRSLLLSEGDYDVDVVTFDQPFTGGTPAVKSALINGQSSTVQSSLLMGVSVNGTPTVRDEDLVDTGSSIGGGDSGGAPAIEGVLVGVRGQSTLRVVRTGVSEPWAARIRLVCWERDIQ